jgi:DNA-binding transcriptional regulator GbsR (MarR family)
MSPRGGQADPRRFIERFALALTEGGVPRMPARAFACILANDTGQMTASELANQLEVSPAAISGAVRYLVQVKLVHKVREPGSRSDHYQLSDDLWYTAVADRSDLLTRWEEALAEGIVVLGAKSPAGKRLAETQEFFAFLREEMPQLLDRWQRHRARQAKAAGRPKSR